MSALTLTIATILLSANNAPVPFATTPTEILQTVRFNAATTDEHLQDQWVEVTGMISSIGKDGLGNYVAMMETTVRDYTGTYTGTMRFTFAPTFRGELAMLAPPGQPATIRGVCRKIDNFLNRLTRNTVVVDVLDCELAEAIPAPVPAPAPAAIPAPAPAAVPAPALVPAAK